MKLNHNEDQCDNMKLLFTVIISFILMSYNSVFAEDNKNKHLQNKNTIDCSAEPVIKYIPIKGLDNSSLMYAVLINHKEKKYQLIVDDKDYIKCIFN